MLIDKSNLLSPGDVVGIKLTTGEEVVAKLVSESSEGYTVSKPLTLVPGPQGLGMMQTVMSLKQDAEVTIKKIHVIIIGPAVEQLSKHYLETTSGLQIVSAI